MDLVYYSFVMLEHIRYSNFGALPIAPAVGVYREQQMSYKDRRNDILGRDNLVSYAPHIIKVKEVKSEMTEWDLEAIRVTLPLLRKNAIDQAYIG